MSRRVVLSAVVSAVLVALSGCGDAPYLELQIADPELPFLAAGLDFDAFEVLGRADGCPDVELRAPAAPLPATLSVLPGDCYRASITLRAQALLAGRVIAESGELDVDFPGSGPLVVTATLADSGQRLLFDTGFESGDPGGPIDVVRTAGIADLVARLDTASALTGAQSVLLSGTATAATAHVLVRVAMTDIEIARGDELLVTVAVEEGSVARTVGLELELSSGGSAASLGLSEAGGRPIHAASADGRVPGVTQQWRINLSAAAGAVLHRVLFGFDARVEGTTGAFAARLDDLAVVRP